MAQLALDVVVPGEGFPQSFQLIGHGHSGKGRMRLGMDDGI
jgi:hypothetical protein